MDITPEILAQTGEMLKKHLEDYSKDIDTAFGNFEEAVKAFEEYKRNDPK